MGFQDRLVSHGLRSMASTILNEYGWDPELIDVALAHVDKDEVRGAYNRTDYIERRRPMMAWWSEHIQKAATGHRQPVDIGHQSNQRSQRRTDSPNIQKVSATDTIRVV